MLSLEPWISHRMGALCMDPWVSDQTWDLLPNWLLCVWARALCQTRDLSQDGCSLYGPVLSVKPLNLSQDRCSLSNPGSLTGLVLSVWARALCQTRDLSQDGSSLYVNLCSLIKPRISHRMGALCMDQCSLLNLGSLTGRVLSVWTSALCRTQDLSQDGCSVSNPV